MVNGKLLQMDKKYKHLKQSQKERITQWMFEETKLFYQKNYVFPNEKQVSEVIDRVYARIEDEEIWIPYSEISKRYRSKRSDINKRVRREMNLHEDRRTETVTFTNMCMVQDAGGNVVTLDKKSGGYVGTTFPGGHLEEGETFYDSVIREVREETGLEIRNPLFCGVYHWTKNGVHNVIFLYKATEFEGELKSSDEGEVYWVPIGEYRHMELAGGMDQVLKIVCDGTAHECWMHLEDGRYQEYMY